MNLVCAWCGASIERQGYNHLDPSTSHGMCPACSHVLTSRDNGLSLQTHIDSIPIPIVLVNRDNSVVATNAEAARMLGRNAETAIDLPFGTVFDCIHSHLPEGCGRTIHCSGCVIRNCVKETFNTGAPQRSVPATLTVEGPDRPSQAVLTVTTVKGDGVVVMRIEQVS